MAAFDDVQTATLGRAYEQSRARAIQDGALQVFDADTAQHVLASRIIKLAQSGEIHEARLTRGALHHFGRVRGEQEARQARYERAAMSVPVAAEPLEAL